MVLCRWLTQLAHEVASAVVSATVEASVAVTARGATVVVATEATGDVGVDAVVDAGTRRRSGYHAPSLVALYSR